MRTRLGVNIDHVATVRQARGVDYPSVLEAAAICETAGAHGITVHLREDRRHIQDADVRALRKTIRTRFNLEMANTPAIVGIAMEVHPDEVCLVPEKRRELTTEGGLDVRGQKVDLARTVETFTSAGIVTSLFIAPDPDQIAAASEIGAPCIELHTGAFCDSSGTAADCELDRLIKGARQCRQLGIQVNAGHGINLTNIRSVLRIPFLDTLNIGHSIVARAVLVGMDRAVREMLHEISAHGGGHDE